ncbi:hypothetical protein SynPROSU1_03059 [Synechococcus sp. PROS-U-1]|nr:hypothetical protein SynPROSU1_03059 [Synechococcus sp. PROS-U-1]
MSSVMVSIRRSRDTPFIQVFDVVCLSSADSFGTHPGTA